MTRSPFRREEIWVSFEGTRKAKPQVKTDLEYFEEETRRDEMHEETGWVEELFQIQERLEDGSILALYEGILTCDEEQIPLPTWLQEALKKLVVSIATGMPFEESKRGRSNSGTGRMREEMKRYLRKASVEAVRRYQALEPCFFAFSLLPVGLKRLYNQKALPDFGSTIDEAIHFASLGLRGTFAQASEETIRKAFFSAEDEGWGPWPFSRPEALEAIGIENPICQYFPIGFHPVSNATGDLLAGSQLDLPDALVEGQVGPRLDAKSIEYLNAASEYERFDDFIEIERKKRRSGNS